MMPRTGSDVPNYSWIDPTLPDRPADAEYGTTWRSKEIYRCPICHTLTNKWVIGGYPSRGPRILCPANTHSTPSDATTEQQQDRHDELEALLDRKATLEKRLRWYQATNRSENAVVERIQEELEINSERVDMLRTWFEGRFDDVAKVSPEEHQVIDGLQPGISSEATD